MKKQNNLLRMILTALCLALAMVLPFLTGQIPEIGSMLCPLHIPVLLCGFLCGWPWGFAVGLIAPLMRSALFGMPPFFPTAVCMTFELATYGAVAGLMHSRLPKKVPCVYASLLTAMLSGRLVWGLAMLVCTGAQGFSAAAFVAGAFTNAVPGIVLQIVLIPLVVQFGEKAMQKKM